MYITGLTHKDELFDLTIRWLNNDPQPDDGLTVSRIFFYEGIIAASWVIPGMFRFLQRTCNGTLRLERIRQKHELRERLIRYLPRSSPRIDRLIADFRENPEFFFPRLPMDAVLALAPGDRLVSVGRIKRMSRVAEKVSFRLIDALFRQIRTEAERIAKKRAADAGVPVTDLISTPEAMERDFVEAETTVAARFRDKTMRFHRESLVINDMTGFKMIGDPETLEALMARVADEPGVSVVEIERHAGDYNAVNMVVDLALPTPGVILQAASNHGWSGAALRGLDPELLREGFGDYVAAGDRTVRMELIFTTYPELIESEIGRSIHELRILRLRDRAAYSGLIAQNAGYLIEYLLSLALSPVVNIAELPIKLYGRYLPETARATTCRLFGSATEGSLLDAFCRLPECVIE